jgi:hypothetical protein
MDVYEIYTKADDAGRKAVEALQVRPMVVTRRDNPMDDNSPVVQSWYVEDGVCGFAWVNIKPANSKFAKFLLRNGLARKDSYYGGVTVWVSDYNQSMQKKEAYAHAFAKVIRECGIDKCYASSRMD